MTWAQLGLHTKPCGLLNVAGFYDPLLKFLDGAVRHELVKAIIASSWSAPRMPPSFSIA